MVLLVSLIFTTGFAQDFDYETVPGDPLNARIYTLKNGLKVYMTVYKDEPRIQTFVAIKAGSKYDPAHATGLAHYLEHIMFKGTPNIGTTNWKAEKPLLDDVEQLYQLYRQTTDTVMRQKIYHKIDSISLLASHYAVANEYDKLVSSIGATGTNAYTSFEETVYINDIPSNEIEKWAMIESERFSHMTPRLFHTELEAVYEEKNMGMDNDRRQMWEVLLAALFPTHQYGTQTTIGTIEHLKNPSITEIKKYFNTYYVANNMAICVSGDFDPDEYIKIIAREFDKLPTREVPVYKAPVEKPISGPVVKSVTGPNAETVALGFRLPGISTRESMLMELVSMILSNSQAGLIDLNLNQKQKVLGGYSYPMRLKDYSAHILAASPKQGQTLEEVKALLLSQLELIKKGEFDDWLLEAIINDYKVSQMKQYESNRYRASAFVTAFTSELPWNAYVNELDKMEKVTKQEIVDFVKEHYQDNYVQVNKLQGENPNTQKVPKPPITPVEVNREDQSAYYLQLDTFAVEPIAPVFVDYEKDFYKGEYNKQIEFLAKKNVENKLFKLYYYFDFGALHDEKLSLAVNYLDFLGTNELSAEEVQKEFYKLGCTFGVSAGQEEIYMYVSGLEENFDAAVALFEKLIGNAKADQQVYENMVDDILKSRSDAKLDKGTILKSGMVSYAKYGEKSPFTDILSEEELKSIDPNQLTALIKDLRNYPHKIIYYGPSEVKEVSKRLKKLKYTPKKYKAIPEKRVYEEQEIDKTNILFVDYDMVQAEVIFLSKSHKYNAEIVPTVNLYNEYFGGNMGSVVFQDMRESKALAYSVRSYYSMPSDLEHHSYNVSYIGTQSDKLFEAMDGMNALLDGMPKSEVLFKSSKASILSQIRTNRVTKVSLIFNYLNAQDLGNDHDMRKDVFEEVPSLTFDDIVAFQEKEISGQPQTILIISKKENIDFEQLKTYGNVKELTLEEVFGY